MAKIWKYLTSRASRLRKRWEGEERRIQKIIQALRRNEDWTVLLVRSVEDGWEDLPFLETCPSQYIVEETRGAPSPRYRDLRGIPLSDCDLSDRERLADTCLDYASFSHVNLTGASLNNVSMQDAQVDDTCQMDEASLRASSLRFTSFHGVSMAGAKIRLANIEGCDFEEAVLDGADLYGTRYSREGVLGFVRPILHLLFRSIRKRAWTRFGGEYQKITPSTSSASLLKYMRGENGRWSYLKEAREPRRSGGGSVRTPIHLLGIMFGRFWGISSDYGRKPLRVFLFSILLCILFGALYAGYPLPTWLGLSGDRGVGKVLCALHPQIYWTETDEKRAEGDTENEAHLIKSWITPYYYSAVVMFTLGFGDVHPICWLAQLCVILQVAIGYVFLGLLVGCLVQAMSHA